MFNIVFILVIVIFIVSIVRNVSEWNRNKHSPLLSIDAVVKSKRISTSATQIPNGGDASGAQGFHTTTTTYHYVTFQFESGDCMEFRVNSSEYASLSDGYKGKLSFQGSRYIRFDRQE